MFCCVAAQVQGDAITPVRDTNRSLKEEKHFNFTSPLDPVSYVPSLT